MRTCPAWSSLAADGDFFIQNVCRRWALLQLFEIYVIHQELRQEDQGPAQGDLVRGRSPHCGRRDAVLHVPAAGSGAKVSALVAPALVRRHVQVEEYESAVKERDAVSSELSKARGFKRCV